MKFPVKNFISLAIIVVLLFGCNSKNFDDRVANLNKGELAIFADESYKSLIDELIKSYENVYPESKIVATYGSDYDIMEAMLHDKTRMIVTGRTLTQKEIEEIEKIQGIVPEQYSIAKEAVAIITSAENTDTVFDLDEFYLSRQPGYAGKYKDKKFVFNRENASMISQLTGEQTSSLTNMFSLDNSDTISAYISSTQNAFGFIAFAELSDVDNPAAGKLLAGNKILSVAKKDSTGEKIIYELSQSTIATNKYPLQRPVNIVKGNVSQLLGTGFVNFMYRDKAGRIILKAGLVPAKMPERQIRIVE
ncbi:MAG: PstS family phosphate ABC transporter substrate-binding protein [Chitinophagales bacterium]